MGCVQPVARGSRLDYALTCETVDVDVPVGERLALYLNAIVQDGELVDHVDGALAFEDSQTEPGSLDVSRRRLRFIDRDHREGDSPAKWGPNSHRGARPIPAGQRVVYLAGDVWEALDAERLADEDPEA